MGQITSELTHREIEVLQLLAEGRSNKEIGFYLGTSFETAKSHVRHIIGKLDARSRAHAVAIAMRSNLIR